MHLTQKYSLRFLCLQGHDEHVTKLRQDFERQVKGLQHWILRIFKIKLFDSYDSTFVYRN